MGTIANHQQRMREWSRRNDAAWARIMALKSAIRDAESAGDDEPALRLREEHDALCAAAEADVMPALSPPPPRTPGKQALYLLGVALLCLGAALFVWITGTWPVLVATWLVAGLCAIIVWMLSALRDFFKG